MKTKLLKIDDIVFDEDIYCRSNWSWQTSYDYAQSMKTGANFPHIVVALFNRHYVLVDGKHRLEALKQNKEKYTTCEVIKKRNKKQLYEEAIKRNIQHGRPLSPQEKRTACLRLKSWNYTTTKISKIVQIPLDKVTDFQAKTLVNTLTGEKIALKAPFENLAGTTVKEDVIDMQKHFNAYSQVHLFTQMIELIESDAIDLKNKGVVEKIEELYYALDGLINKVTKKATAKAR